MKIRSVIAKGVIVTVTTMLGLGVRSATESTTGPQQQSRLSKQGPEQAPSKALTPTLNLSFSSATIPIFSGEEDRPTAILTLGKVRQEYERLGFFRIGALPCWVVEGLAISIRRRESLNRALPAIDRLFRTNGASRRVEFRNISVGLMGGTSKWLSVERLRTEGPGEWELTGLTIHKSNGETSYTRQASLRFAESGNLEVTPAGAADSQPLNLLTMPAEPSSVDSQPQGKPQP